MLHHLTRSHLLSRGLLMANVSEDQWNRLIEGLRTGDEQVLADFYQQHGATLRAIADKQLAPELRRRVSPSEVVQSAFRTFFRRAGEGRFEFEDSEKLWSLMCAITLTKVREQVRYHRREKRDIHRESDPDPAQEGYGLGVLQGRDMPPEIAVEFEDQFERLMEALDDEEQQVVQMKLDDRTNDEVADALGVSERTVRRIMKRLQTRFQFLLEDQD